MSQAELCFPSAELLCFLFGLFFDTEEDGTKRCYVPEEWVIRSHRCQSRVRQVLLLSVSIDLTLRVYYIDISAFA
jgi:hypothetical protein